MYLLVIDEAWGQDGRILAEVLFFCMFMDRDRDGVEVHKHTQKNKERGQYPAIKNYGLFNFPGNISCGTCRVVPSSGSQSQRRI